MPPRVRRLHQGRSLRRGVRPLHHRHAPPGRAPRFPHRFHGPLRSRSQRYRRRPRARQRLRLLALSHGSPAPSRPLDRRRSSQPLVPAPRRIRAGLSRLPLPVRLPGHPPFPAPLSRRSFLRRHLFRSPRTSPLESLSFVLSELARVLRPGGLLIITSPNQASLENRLRLLNGSSILAMPDDIAASGLFGHIRLYTPSEIVSAMAKLGFSLERGAAESNNSAYRGPHKSWRRRVYRFYEALEGFLPFLRTMSDTWFMAFRKNAVAP